MIKLKCSKCEYSFEVSELEFKEHPILYKECFVGCGGMNNQVTNLDELVLSEIDRQINNNINKWFNTLGIEGTVELIERNSNYAISRLYQQELRRRGVIK